MPKRMFEIPDSKPQFAQWFTEVDISNWLGEVDTISNVNFEARDLATGDDASEIILDQGKCVWSEAILKPYIRGGVLGTTYRITIDVITASGDQEVFWVDVTVKDEDE